jgi:hypothetical protein
MASFDLYWPHIGFCGAQWTYYPHGYFVEPSLPTSRWFVAGRMRQPRMMIGSGITGSQNFIPGAETRFQLSRDFANDCRTWDPGGHMYDMSVRFFPRCVYIDLSHHDSLGYEWPFVCYIHLVVCLVYCLWFEDEHGYGIIMMMITVFTLPLMLTWVNILLVYECSL